MMLKASLPASQRLSWHARILCWTACTIVASFALSESSMDKHGLCKFGATAVNQDTDIEGSFCVEKSSLKKFLATLIRPLAHICLCYTGWMLRLAR